MTDFGAERALCDATVRGGVPIAEVFSREGRSRRSQLAVDAFTTVMNFEAGWAVRAGGAAGCAFVAGSGTTPPEITLPPLSGAPLQLPREEGGPPSVDAPPRSAPLMAEGEAKGLLDGVARELAAQLPGARLLRAVLDDGASSSRVVNAHGLEVAYRNRLTMLRLEGLWSRSSPIRASLEVVEREAHRLQPAALARRLADLLAIRGGVPAPPRERGEMLLGPVVAGRLVGALSPLWVGPAAAESAREMSGADDRLGSSKLAVVDDGRLDGGPLSAPYDGEGVATRRIALVREGRYRQPLVDWREADPPRWLPSGCMRRASWREQPAPGPSQLFIEPDSGVATGEMVADVVRGFYLLDTLGPVRVSFADDRFAVPVCGFSLSRGRAAEAISAGWLTGGISTLLRGVRRVARDLGFVVDRGLVGSPTLLTVGLELRREL